MLPSVREARKYVRMAPDLRTWVPQQAEQQFNFGDKTKQLASNQCEKKEEKEIVDAELTPEEQTLCEWATGRYFQKWCGTYYRAHSLDVEAAVSLIRQLKGAFSLLPGPHWIPAV